MRTSRVRGIAVFVATKQDTDKAWAVYPYVNHGLDSRSGVIDDPKWREKIKAMVDATHPYSRVIWPARGSYWKQMNVDWYWTWRELFVPHALRSSQLRGSPGLSSFAAQSFTRGIPQSASVVRAKSTARLAFLSKIREQQTPFQGLAFLGELKETISMVKHPLRGIIRQNANSARHFTVLQRLYRKNSSRLEDMMEKAYLQWTYGVMPLVGDIQAVLGNCSKIFEEPEVIRLRVTIPVEESKLYSANNILALEGSSQTVGVFFEIKASGYVRIVGAMRHSKSPASMAKFNQINGLQLRDIVPAAWELTPYSFLADYFVNVGDVLGGVFTDTSDLVYSCMTTKLLSDGRCISYGLPGTFKPVTWPFAMVPGRLVKVSLNREKADLSVGFKDINWQDPTVGQLFNTAVLSSQKLRDVAFRYTPS
jgi:hypothetical protein